MRSMRPIWSLRSVLASSLVLAMCSGLAACSSTRVVTVQEEIQAGQAQRAQVKRSLKSVRDRAVVFYVRKLGGSLADAAGPTPFRIQFDVIEDESLNAFATFGGNIFVNTGTILAAQSVDELAGVLSHEIGHVNGRHLAKANPVNQRANFVTRLLGLTVAIVSGRRAAQNTTAILSNIGGAAYVTAFTRDAEREADSLGIQTMIRAGYDPNALVTFFQRIKAEGERGGLPDFLKSHPIADERIRNVQAQIARSDVPDEEIPKAPEISQDQFELIQRRIKLLTGQVQDPDFAPDGGAPADDEDSED